MELWEKAGWVHKNCKFANKISNADRTATTCRYAFRHICAIAKANDVDSILRIATQFFKQAVMEINTPTDNPMAKSPIDMAASEIKNQLSQEFTKMKQLRNNQPLLTPDLNRLTMMGFTMMMEKLKERGIQVKDKVSLRQVVQNVVDGLAHEQRDQSMAVPTQDRFMHDKPTRAVEDLARDTVNRFTGQPKVPQPRVPQQRM